MFRYKERKRRYIIIFNFIVEKTKYVVATFLTSVLIRFYTCVLVWFLNIRIS
jgi:hypothetical protein